MICFRRAPVVFLLTAFGSWFGCGGGTNPAQSNSNCVMTVSGAVTAKLQCTVVAANDTSKNQGGIGITGIPQAPVTTAQIALAAPGSFHTGTYSSASAATYAATVMSGSSGVPMVWVSSNNPVRGGPITIAITSSSAIVSAAGGTAYAVHGSADATLAGTPETGATGAVIVHATF